MNSISLQPRKVLHEASTPERLLDTPSKLTSKSTVHSAQTNHARGFIDITDPERTCSGKSEEPPEK